MYYAMWIATKCRSVRLECFDYAEVPGIEKFEWGGCQITIERHAKAYDGTGIGYDAVIDDAYLPGAGIVSQKSYVCPYYSIKQSAGSFLHPNEGREFSQSPVDGDTYCECMVCRVCSSVTVSYDEYVFLRRICTVLGHDTRCLNDPAQHEMVLKGDTLREILSQSTFTVRPGQIARAVIALATEVPLKAVSSNTVALNPEGKEGVLAYNHRLGVLGLQDAGDRCDRLTGKRVSFVGVLPSILGSTKLAHGNVKNSYYASWDVIFASGLEALQANTVSSVAFVPRDVVMSDDWQATGYSWRGFYEYSHVPSEVLSVAIWPGATHSKTQKERAPSSLVTVSHPILLKVERSFSNQLLGNFHCYRDDDGLKRIDSDFPLTHVYETDVVRVCRRGKVVSPHLRSYALQFGYYVGSVAQAFDPGIFQCLVELIDGEMMWDFVGPDTWPIVTRLSYDNLRVMGLSLQYIGVARRPGDPFITYVPITWDAKEVSVATGLRDPIRESWGWLGQGDSIDHSLPIVQDLIRDGRHQDPIIAWFQTNGWTDHFSFEKEKRTTRIVGLKDWSRFFQVSVRSIKELYKDIMAQFLCTADGPYSSLLDLRTYDRSGRPKKNGRRDKRGRSRVDNDGCGKPIPPPPKGPGPGD
jgi:hypothetical protein